MGGGAIDRVICLENKQTKPKSFTASFFRRLLCCCSGSRQISHSLFERVTASLTLRSARNACTGAYAGSCKIYCSPHTCYARSRQLPTGCSPPSFFFFLSFAFWNVAPARQSLYDQPAGRDTRSDPHAPLLHVGTTSERTHRPSRSGPRRPLRLDSFSPPRPVTRL